ncbi:unnamed protein product [Caenorhabditis angaria]|uniref:Uncharacterized protein n=1 Tax=Caenorhabditis angaria TaxID=860376 RepID=A0A9P1ING2_9PELO|nr:unnamed protein product [Caenorhabditis angaria]
MGNYLGAEKEERQTVICRRVENYRHMSVTPNQENTSRNEVQTLVTMGAVVLILTIIVLIGRANNSAFGDREYILLTPTFWLFCILMFSALCQLIDVIRKRKIQRESVANVQSLLVEMNFPESFPCLLAGPHDECCGGRGIVQKPLPTYDELVVDDETAKPPTYTRALTMLQEKQQFS